jgi:uncharacterized protein YpuA (DUF1002 family)
MEISKEIKAIAYDVKVVLAAAEVAKKEAQTAMNRLNLCDTKAQKIDSLCEAMTDAEYEFDSLKDRLKDLQDQLDILLEMVEYDSISKATQEKG